MQGQLPSRTLMVFVCLLEQAQKCQRALTIANSTHGLDESSSHAATLPHCGVKLRAEIFRTDRNEKGAQACPEKIEMTVFGCQNIQIKDESGMRKMPGKTARKLRRHSPTVRLDG